MRITSLAVLALTAGCLDPRAEVRVSSPVFTFDVDAERAAFEQALCAEAGDACGVLGDLDAFDDGRVSSPPRLPAALPRELSREGNVLAVEPWLNEQRARYDFMPSLRAPLAFDAATIDPAGLDAQLLAATLHIEDNSLTFDLPQMRLGIERDGEVIDVGVIESPEGELALVHLVQGGAETLLDAVTSGAAIVIEPEGGLELSEGLDATLVRPGGSASLSFALDVGVSVMPVLEEAMN